MKLSIVWDVAFLGAAVFVVAFVVLGNAYSSADGYISPDSANYLRLSERLLGGHGLNVPADGRLGASEVWFAIWPAGYPIIIAAVSWMTGASTFLAAKIVNVLVMSGSLTLLYKFLGRDGLIAGTVLLSAGTLHIFSMTWSEAPFLTSLIALCLVLASVVNGKFRINGVLLGILPLLIALPFAFRYIGVFVLAPVALAIFHLYRRERIGEAWRLVLAASVSLAIFAVVLWNNWMQTGYPTGSYRMAAPESHVRLLEVLLVTVLREITLPLVVWFPRNLGQSLLVLVWAIPALLLGAMLIRARGVRMEDCARVQSKYFFVFGAFYLSSIVLLRWNVHFDEFSLRLLDPGFSLLSVGAVLWVLNTYRPHAGAISIFFVATACLSALLLVVNILNRPGFGTYSTQRDQAVARYASLPEESIVVFGENALFYLRPNIQVAYPRFKPYAGKNEPWQAFLRTLQTDVPIFVEMGPRARIRNRYHPSVRELVASYPTDGLVTLMP